MPERGGPRPPERGRIKSSPRATAILIAAAQAQPPTRPRAAARPLPRPLPGLLSPTGSRPGFTYAELLVCIGIIGVLTALAVPLIGRSRASAQSVACVAHLRQIGAAFFQYAVDNDKRLPDPFEAQTSWEQILRKYLPHEGVFRCPADEELFPAVGSSYDWRDTGRPETTLAGRLITDTNRPDPVLAFEALPGWHMKGRMNAVTLSGAGLSMDQDQCLEDLQQPVRPPQPKRPRPQGGGGVGPEGDPPPSRGRGGAN